MLHVDIFIWSQRTSYFGYAYTQPYDEWDGSVNKWSNNTNIYYCPVIVICFDGCVRWWVSLNTYNLTLRCFCGQIVYLLVDRFVSFTCKIFEWLVHSIVRARSCYELCGWPLAQQVGWLSNLICLIKNRMIND